MLESFRRQLYSTYPSTILPVLTVSSSEDSEKVEPIIVEADEEVREVEADEGQELVSNTAIFSFPM